MKRILKSTKFIPFSKKVYGFDIETYGQKNKFYSASIYYDENNYWYFTDKNKLIKFLKTKRFWGSYIVATNLHFDFYGLFTDTEELKQFTPMFRASHLISTKSYIYNKDFNVNRNNKNKMNTSITFIDTMNYVRYSVDDLGEIIGIPKMNKPKCFKRKPRNTKEYQELKRYNIRDSEISKKALDFIFNSFSDLGASPKITIASSALSLFKNIYLGDNVFFGHSLSDLDKQFKTYYGGRVEAFKRGKIENHFYYDFNSLYPAMMLNPVPDPNSIHRNYKNNMYYINNYHGIAEITFHCPDMKYPLLPVRTDDGKLLFPKGKYRGWYSNIEIRRAVELGYTIIEVHENQYYTRTIRIFKKYVEDLYSLRLKYKKEKNPMELVVKLLLNSLYGKFAQKFEDQVELLPDNLTLKQIQSYKEIDRIDGFFRVKKKPEDCNPAMFCFPIWSLYITAYGRLKLHEYMLKTNPVYVDTDSLITTTEIKTSNELGELKLEKFIDNGIIVKPKFYMTESSGKYDIKVKGVGIKLTYKMWLELILSGKIKYDKFVKFKESLRRKLTVNEIIEIEKHLSLEDTKRKWDGLFNPNILQDSDPIDINEYVAEKVKEKTIIKVKEKIQKVL